MKNFLIWKTTSLGFQTHLHSFHKNGDVVVWDLRHGKYGHIAIATGEGTTKWFKSYDQNWIIKKMHLVKHNYKGGFARCVKTS